MKLQLQMLQMGKQPLIQQRTKQWPGWYGACMTKIHDQPGSGLDTAHPQPHRSIAYRKLDAKRLIVPQILRVEEARDAACEGVVAEAKHLPHGRPICVQEGGQCEQPGVPPLGRNVSEEAVVGGVEGPQCEEHAVVGR